MNETNSALSPNDRAWQIAQGNLIGGDSATEIVGAQNDYNARGNGSTMARRVLRNGNWEWVSSPASRGRFRASDRHDITKGYVYEGEVVAEFTLGGNKTPNQMYLVRESDTPLLIMSFEKIKSGYRMKRIVSGQPTGEMVEVSDPYWK